MKKTTVGLRCTIHLPHQKKTSNFLYTDPARARLRMLMTLAINGVEVGGGSIRIYDKALQAEMFKRLDLRKKKRKTIGFLMNAFEFGAPPRGGLAFGFDRLCAVLNSVETIRDFIAFPKK